VKNLICAQRVRICEGSNIFYQTQDNNMEAFPLCRIDGTSWKTADKKCR